MTATEDATPEVPLTWTSRVTWGCVGKAHYTEATINGEAWTFTVDQPRKGYWVARAWRDGKCAMYQEGKTLKSMKAAVQAQANFAATSTCAECRHIGGHTVSCPTIGRSAVAGFEAGLRDVQRTLAQMAPILVKAMAPFSRIVRSFQLTQRCSCPTPTHRMSCGVDAIPKVVTQ